MINSPLIVVMAWRGDAIYHQRRNACPRIRPHVCTREGCRGRYVFARRVFLFLSSSLSSFSSFFSATSSSSSSSSTPPPRLFTRESSPRATHFRNGPYRARMGRRLEGKIYFVIMKIADLQRVRSTPPPFSGADFVETRASEFFAKRVFPFGDHSKLSA